MSHHLEMYATFIFLLLYTMKKMITLILVIFSIALFILSCKKDKLHNPEDVRLVEAEYAQNGLIYRTIIDYNAAGKVIKVSSQENRNTPSVRFDVLYVNNEVLLIGGDAT